MRTVVARSKLNVFQQLTQIPFIYEPHMYDGAVCANARSFASRWDRSTWSVGLGSLWARVATRARERDTLKVKRVKYGGEQKERCARGATTEKRNAATIAHEFFLSLEKLIKKPTEFLSTFWLSPKTKLPPLRCGFWVKFSVLSVCRAECHVFFEALVSNVEK